MSNCIHIEGNARVHFEPDEIDAQGLKELLDKAEEKVSELNCVSEEIEPDLRLAWWYLPQTKIREDNSVDIHFGLGRSTHTWRDFRGTLKVINKFVKKPKVHTFQISDESDAFEEVVNSIVVFQNPESTTDKLK